MCSVVSLCNPRDCNPPPQAAPGVLGGAPGQGRGASLISGHPPLLQDLGMESTSLDDVLYRYASFRNLVDPITHDLIISLARYIHCPKPVGQPWSEPARSGV